MDTGQQKVVQYLNEAHASEHALTRVLESQIAMTPAGTFRTGLETHLKETRDHAKRVGKRLQELEQGRNPLQLIAGVTETVIGQALALGKTPLDLLRGTGGDEKVLKNAKDAAATEALEIATYTALEQLARTTGDTKTADLAKSIRRDEEQMLDRILREIPKLTEAVVDGTSFDVASTGAAQAPARAAKATKRAAKKATAKPRAKARKAAAARTQEPWSGYDELTVEEITSVLSEGGDARVKRARTYERANKNRAGVLEVADRELSNA